MTMRRSNTNIFSKMFIFIFDYESLYILLMTYFIRVCTSIFALYSVSLYCKPFRQRKTVKQRTDIFF